MAQRPSAAGMILYGPAPSHKIGPERRVRYIQKIVTGSLLAETFDEIGTNEAIADTGVGNHFDDSDPGLKFRSWLVEKCRKGGKRPSWRRPNQCAAKAAHRSDV